MKTSELVSHVTGAMLDDRAELVSGENDELYSDTVVVRYLNEAQRVLCRRAWVLEDTTGANPATLIPLIENRTDYALHKSVLFVKSVRLSDSDIDLRRAGYNDNRLLPWPVVVDPDYWDQNTVLTETAGRPSKFSTDMGTRIIRVRQKPDATAAALSLKLVVVRMPIKDLDLADGNRAPEVPEDFHLDLTLYAAGKCLSNTADIDADQRSLGRAWVKEFDDKVAEAKRDRQRLQQSEPQARFGGWVSGR